MNTKTEQSTGSLNNDRLLSIDALRGFDMFWIAGGGAVIHQAAELSRWDWLVLISSQMEHPQWHGFTFYDLIFPLFLFIAGVSMPFSFEKRMRRGDSKSKLYKHVVTRGLVLVLLGLIHNGLLKFEWESLRCASVLGRIGLAYLFAGLIVLNTGFRGRIIWFAGLLIAYWAALEFIPVPGFGAGDLSPGHTLTDYIDRMLLPGTLYQGDRDPEGILGIVPAIATALSGVMAGQLLKMENRSSLFKVAVMVVLGLCSLGLAHLWNTSFPINKNLWSSSFVLNCTGYSLLILSLFYLVIDVWKLRKWSFFFVVIGSNSILIYMAPQFINFGYTANAIFGGSLEHAGEYTGLLTAVCVLAVQWSMLYLCYRYKIFLKV